MKGKLIIAVAMFCTVFQISSMVKEREGSVTTGVYAGPAEKRGSITSPDYGGLIERRGYAPSIGYYAGAAKEDSQKMPEENYYGGLIERRGYAPATGSYAGGGVNDKK